MLLSDRLDPEASLPPKDITPCFPTGTKTSVCPLLPSPGILPNMEWKSSSGYETAVLGARGGGSPSFDQVFPCQTKVHKSRRRPTFRRSRTYSSLPQSAGLPQLFTVLLQLLLPLLSVASIIKEPPRRTVPHAFEMLTVPRSDDLSLSCPLIGTPTPIFEWTKDSESVPEDAGWDRIAVTKSQLKIRDVQMEDRGRYECTAINGFGKLNYTFIVTINDPLAPPSLHDDQGAPTLLQVFPQPHGLPITINAGLSISLKCRVAGAPEPVVVWYKDGFPITEGDPPTLVHSNDLHTLHFSRLHRADSGLYTCTATNLYGAVTANWTLRVSGIERGGSAVSSPALTPTPLRAHNASVLEGEKEAALTCDGPSGSGEPHVKWLRARGSSDDSEALGDPFIEWRGRVFAVLPPSSVFMKQPGIFVTKLVIEHPEEEDAGDYVCMATTTEGTAVGTASLSVVARGPGSILLAVMGLLGSIAVIAVVTAVVATYRRRRRQQRHVGAYKPAPAGGAYKGHPSSQASSNLLQAEDYHRQPIGKNGTASSLNGGPAPRCVRPPGVQGRVGDSGALLPNQDGMIGRYPDPGSASVYLSGQQGLNDSSGGSDYKPPLTPLNDYQQQQYQQIGAPQQYHLPPQQYQLPQQQHLLTTQQQQCSLQQHPPLQQQQQYQTPLQQQCTVSHQQQHQVTQPQPQQLQYHQLDVI